MQLSLANLKGQKPATNFRPGSHRNLLTAKGICIITTYYYVILHDYMAITSEILQNNFALLRITTKTFPSITTYYDIAYYFVLLPYYFHITSILLPITTWEGLLPITTNGITTYCILLLYSAMISPLLRITMIRYYFIA